MSSKPTITLKIGAAGGFNPRSPSITTPTSGGGPKIRLSMGGGSKPSTPSEATAKTTPTTKAGRAPKPSAKAIANKNGKRIKSESDDEDELHYNPIAEAIRQPKKIKLSMGSAGTPKTPIALKAKFKGKPPKRPLGEGYDSEASDREDDPLIEEEFILRMQEGEDCDYLRNAIENRLIGIPRSQGGADVQMKFIHPDGRRALVTIRGHHYAATLVDLPCVIEGMKSWDKRGWWKSADICQMLLVFAKVRNEAEAGTIDLPPIVDSETFQYPHGLTPPMHFARKRRFRKRISRTAIEAVEDAVEKLLEADARAQSVRHEVVEMDAGSRFGSQPFGSPDPDEDAQYSEDEVDAEGEVDEPDGYFNQIHAARNAVQQGENQDDDLAAAMEADLEAAFEAELDAGTPSSNAVAETPSVLDTGVTPDASGLTAEDSGDESVEDDDDERDSDDGVDEDEKSRLAQLQGAKEDIAEMERQLENLKQQVAAQVNPILKKRLQDNIERVKAELELKKSAIGEGDEE